MRMSLLSKKRCQTKTEVILKGPVLVFTSH